MVTARIIGLSLLAAAVPAFAADCSSQVVPQGSYPTDNDIATMLKWQIEPFCSGAELNMTDTSGNNAGNFTVNIGHLAISVTWTDSVTWTSLFLSNCVNAMLDIIDQCLYVEGVDQAGALGTWSYAGTAYTITNEVS
jgi:hypothetical protein